MTESDANTTNASRWPSGRKAIINLVSFVVGLGLFAWVVRAAVTEGAGADGWERLRSTSPWLLAALLGCTALSALLNASTFWVTSLPLHRQRWVDMQLLNLVANMLNYAPFRLGAIGRVAYHVRIDGMKLIQIGAWFGVIGMVLMMGVGACLSTAALRSSFDVIWVAMMVGQMVAGGVALRLLANHEIVTRITRGLNELITDPRALWGSISLRILDLGAFTARMYVAARILDLDFAMTHIIVLAVVALVASLAPFKLGFREFCVVLAARQFGTTEDNIETISNQLALVESLGEALFFIPLGALALIWFVPKMRRSPRAEAPEPEAGS